MVCLRGFFPSVCGCHSCRFRSGQVLLIRRFFDLSPHAREEVTGLVQDDPADRFIPARVGEVILDPRLHSSSLVYPRA